MANSFDIEDNIYIIRLRDRVKENPHTKLFLSLSEEFWKKGKEEEAINILSSGIERNPDFLAARLTLVKWYLKKGMFSEAEKEFKEILERFSNIKFDKRIEKVQSALNTVKILNRFLDAVNKRFSSEQ